MAHFTRPLRAELESSGWTKPCILLQKLLLGLVEIQPVFLSNWQKDPLEDIPLETFLAQRWVTGDSTSLKLSLPSCHWMFSAPITLFQAEGFKMLFLPVNLLLSCTISTSVHLLDLFSVLPSFLHVREDEIAAHKLCFNISSPCCVLVFVFLVRARLPQQSDSS